MSLDHVPANRRLAASCWFPGPGAEVRAKRRGTGQWTVPERGGGAQIAFDPVDLAGVIHRHPQIPVRAKHDPRGPLARDCKACVISGLRRVHTTYEASLVFRAEQPAPRAEHQAGYPRVARAQRDRAGARGEETDLAEMKLGVNQCVGDIPSGVSRDRVRRAEKVICGDGSGGGARSAAFV
jgi:hypothetical protein